MIKLPSFSHSISICFFFILQNNHFCVCCYFTPNFCLPLFFIVYDFIVYYFFCVCFSFFLLSVYLSFSPSTPMILYFFIILLSFIHPFIHSIFLSICHTIPSLHHHHDTTTLQPHLLLPCHFLIHIEPH